MLQPRTAFRRGLDPSPWRLVLNSGPIVEPITLTEANAHLRVDASDDDTLISSLIQAAREQIDGAAGYLGRALVEQTWDLKLDWFPSNDTPIGLPLAPLRSVEQITYTDEAGATQTLASSVYQVVGVDAHAGGYVLEAHEQSWPATRDIPEAITIRFKAGYAATNDSPPDYRANVPQPIKQALLLMVSDLYHHRETVATGGETEVPMSMTAKALLGHYRLSWFA